jgi:hypothetical protein
MKVKKYIPLHRLVVAVDDLFDIVSNEVGVNQVHINHLKHVDQKEILYRQKQEVNFERDTLEY